MRWARRAARPSTPEARQAGSRGVRHCPGRHVPGAAQRRRWRDCWTSDFDGLAIGGLSVGEPEPQRLAVLDHTLPLMPRGPAALPDGRRDPGRTSSRRCAGAWTCSIASCPRATPATGTCSPSGASSGSAMPATGTIRGRCRRAASATPAGTTAGPICATWMPAARSSAAASTPSTTCISTCTSCSVCEPPSRRGSCGSSPAAFLARQAANCPGISR